MHDLQRVFATEEGEAAWTQDLHALFGARAFDEAEAMLAGALSALDTELAWTCLELPREAVALSGWEEMAEAIALYEGDPVTGVTIAIANEADRDFEKGAVHHPYVVLGIYTDEAYPFSQASHDEIRDECLSQSPAWAGREEDVEVHMDIKGLDRLNTRLAHHKQRHFFRDDAPETAPRPYVEFVLACWWRALRWHQAVATECAIHGLPGGIPVLAGMVEMRPEAVAMHTSVSFRSLSSFPLASAPTTDTMAASFGAGFIQRRTCEDEAAPPSVSQLRKRVRQDGEVLERPASLSLFARIFGRRR